MQLTNTITRSGGRLTDRRQIRGRIFTGAALLLPLLLVGCAVIFVSSYDEITDREIQEAAKTTEVLIGDVLANQTSYREHAKEYREIDGALGALEMRASNYQKNEAEIELIQKTRAALRDLQRTHKEIGPFRLAEAEGVRSLSFTTNWRRSAAPASEDPHNEFRRYAEENDRGRSRRGKDPLERLSHLC